MELNQAQLFIDLDQAERATIVCMAANVPVGWWGRVGIGKSARVKAIAKQAGLKLYDFRLAGKEPSDLGGIPFPLANERRLEYLVLAGLVPFENDEECIVFFDEYDRAPLEMQNPTLELIQDRTLNGHKLSPNARIIVAGNATTDIGTTPLSKAAMGRVIHLYIHSTLDSWLQWANESGEISPMMRAFAKHNPTVWSNGGEAPPPIEEMGEESNRTWHMADKLLRTASESNFKTDDILPALVAGAISSKAAIPLIAFAKLYGQAPDIDEILAHPDTAEVPERIDVLYALNMALCEASKKDRETAEKVAIYGLRWPEEPGALLFYNLAEKQRTVTTTDAYRAWNRKRSISEGTVEKINQGAPITNAMQALMVDAFPDARALPENDQYINRVQIKSENSGRPYILSQRRSDQELACSCLGWTTRRKCAHLDSLVSKEPSLAPYYKGRN